MPIRPVFEYDIFIHHHLWSDLKTNILFLGLQSSKISSTGLKLPSSTFLMKILALAPAPNFNLYNMMTTQELVKWKPFLFLSVPVLFKETWAACPWQFCTRKAQSWMLLMWATWKNSLGFVREGRRKTENQKLMIHDWCSYTRFGDGG